MEDCGNLLLADGGFSCDSSGWPHQKQEQEKRITAEPRSRVYREPAAGSRPLTPNVRRFFLATLSSDQKSLEFQTPHVLTRDFYMRILAADGSGVPK